MEEQVGRSRGRKRMTGPVGFAGYRIRKDKQAGERSRLEEQMRGPDVRSIWKEQEREEGARNRWEEQEKCRR